MRISAGPVFMTDIFRIALSWSFKEENSTLELKHKESKMFFKDVEVIKTKKCILAISTRSAINIHWAADIPVIVNNNNNNIDGVIQCVPRITWRTWTTSTSTSTTTCKSRDATFNHN